MTRKSTTTFQIKAEDKTKATLKGIQNNFKEMGKSAKNTKGGISGLIDNVVTLGAKLGPLGIALGGVSGAMGAAGVAAVKVGTQYITHADKLNKMSDALNISTEALSQLEFAFSQNGLTIENLQASFRTMNQRISESAKGIGEAKKFLDQMGVSATELNKMPTEKKFLSIAEALGKMSNKSDAAMYAGKIFGEELGARLIPVVGEGAGAIKDLMEQADALGLTLSGKAADGATDMVDAVGELKAAWTGLKNSFMESGFVQATIQNFTDLIDGITEQFTETSEVRNEMNRLYREYGESAMDVGEKELRRVAIANVKSYKEELRTQMSQLDFPSPFTKEGGQIYLDLKLNGEGLENLNVDPLYNLEDIANNITFEKLKTNVDDLNKKLKAVGLTQRVDLMEPQLRMVEGSLQWLSVTRENIDVLKDFQKLYLQLLDKMGDPPGQPGIPTIAPEDLLMDVEFGVGMNVGDFYKQLGFTQESINIAFGKTTEKVKSLRDTMKDTQLLIADAAVAAGDAIMNSFTNAIWDTKAKLIDLGSIAKSIFSSIMSGLLRMGLVALGGAIGGPVGGFISGAFARADGGPVMGNQSYLVGEQGPELFTPRTSGAITPNDKIAGSTTNHFNVTIHAEGNLLNDPLSLRRVTEAINSELEKVQRTYYAATS